MIARGPLENAYAARCRLSTARPVVVRGVVEDLDDRLDPIRPRPGECGARAIAHGAESLADHGPVDAEGPFEVRDVLVAQPVRGDRAALLVPVIDALLPGKHWFVRGGGHASHPRSPA